MSDQLKRALDLLRRLTALDEGNPPDLLGGVSGRVVREFKADLATFLAAHNAGGAGGEQTPQATSGQQRSDGGSEP